MDYLPTTNVAYLPVYLTAIVLCLGGRWQASNLHTRGAARQPDTVGNEEGDRALLL